MRVLITYAHPNPKSFNHAILETITNTLNQNGHEVKVNDLYAKTNFKSTLDKSDFEQMTQGNTPLDIKSEQEAVAWADTLVFIYPIWWFGLPAILKGWIDRVFLHGFAYEYAEGGPKGLLINKKAIIFQTTGGEESTYELNKTKPLIEKTITDGILGFCGISDIHYKAFFAVPTVSVESREGMLKEASEIATSL